MVLSYPGRLLALCAQVEKSAAELCELLDIEQVPMSLQLTRLRPLGLTFLTLLLQLSNYA
jgi:hypothetical protein